MHGIFRGAPLLGRLLFIAALVGACTPSAPLTEQEKLYNHGKAVYLGNCTSCHNVDPHLAGAVGPDVFGSSLPLLSARVLHTQYPPGYKPKRKTSAMAKLPYLENDLPALEVFLNEKK